MADPLSIAASLLAITTAAVQTVNTLREVTRRYKGRDKTLGRLQNELDDLDKILKALEGINFVDEALFSLLQGPIERCSTTCDEFQTAMEAFIRKSKTGLLDWAKMEYRRGDINEFIDSIAVIKSTISVGLGTITLQTSTVTSQVLSEYNELIQDTKHELTVQLHRIEDKMTALTADSSRTAELTVDLNDEREVTKQCLQICEDATAYIQNVSKGASSLLCDSPRTDNQDLRFEAQMRMRDTLDQTRETFARATADLLQRLSALRANEGSEDDRAKLREDLEMQQQCLSVCERASNMSRDKIFKIGEVSADDNSDAMVVTTLADMFNVGKATSTKNSAILIGSMTDESLRDVTEQRYHSRFGQHLPQPGVSTPSTAEARVVTGATRRTPHNPARTAYDQRDATPGASQSKPTSNEMKKRAPGNELP